MKRVLARAVAAVDGAVTAAVGETADEMAAVGAGEMVAAVAAIAVSN